MSVEKLLPRCSIEILNTLGEVVPILDEGASITPGTQYREYWTEEEDLTYVYRQPVIAPDGTVSTFAWPPSDVHGNFGYELLVDKSTGNFSLRIDYFTVLPSTANSKVDYAYEPKSVSTSGTLGQAGKTLIDIELQAGFSEEIGRPDFKLLRVAYK